MSIFDDLGVSVPGLDEPEEEFDGSTEEIFRFDVFITKDQEIEIGVNIMELSVEGEPDFGQEYSFLAHTFAQLLVEHVGSYTEAFMDSVRELPALDVRLDAAEQRILEEEGTGDNGSVLLYSFPVLIMADDENGNGIFEEDEMQIGAGFEKSPKAEVMAKVYGDEFLEKESAYQDSITDAILDHGVLFVKAVSGIQKL